VSILCHLKTHFPPGTGRAGIVSVIACLAQVLFAVR